MNEIPLPTKKVRVFEMPKTDYPHECQACSDPIEGITGLCDTCYYLFDKEWGKD